MAIISQFPDEGEVTPESIAVQFMGMTGIQADDAARPWIGTSLVIRGRPLDQANGNGRLTVTFRDQSEPVVFMYFGLEWLERFRILRRGDLISVKGEIQRVAFDVMHLTNCQLVE